MPHTKHFSPHLLISIKSKQAKTTSQQTTTLSPQNETNARRGSEKPKQIGIYVGIQDTDISAQSGRTLVSFSQTMMATYLSFM